MYILENYDFLEPLVRDGQADIKAPFLRNGFCIADKELNPNAVFVFHFEEEFIWATYAYVKKKNKSFYKFFKELERIMFLFEMPILRKGKNQDFKNHTKKVGYDEKSIKIYEYIKR